MEAHFYGRWERNLVVAGANVLRVFRLVPNQEGDQDAITGVVVNEQTGDVKINGKPVKMRQVFFYSLLSLVSEEKLSISWGTHGLLMMKKGQKYSLFLPLPSVMVEQ